MVPDQGVQINIYGDATHPDFPGIWISLPHIHSEVYNPLRTQYPPPAALSQTIVDPIEEQNKVLISKLKGQILVFLVKNRGHSKGKLHHDQELVLLVISTLLWLVTKLVLLDKCRSRCSIKNEAQHLLHMPHSMQRIVPTQLLWIALLLLTIEVQDILQMILLLPHLLGDQDLSLVVLVADNCHALNPSKLETQLLPIFRKSGSPHKNLVSTMKRYLNISLL
ncbi:hypothetical protein IW261DRAFT_1422228 [Armillaria novae-zelandiae]|uniref:Uncharacterized protein n=1 Tax=Armillaria novae-zelandiae TaxID=153914 RepID=A0AA39U6J9_9AGAR|nr:hypothetical protein IW261DRAFT_1422228 [Armillaria novae-zelandiae]